MSRLTKVYKNGKVTIDAEKFPPITQEAIDREVFNSEPIRTAIERLAEYEDRDAKGCEYCNDNECSLLDWKYGLDHIIPNYKYCPICGRKLRD